MVEAHRQTIRSTGSEIPVRPLGQFELLGRRERGSIGMVGMVGWMKE